MTRGAVLGIACLILLMALAPPGLCPCWLLREVAVLHPHVIAPESPDHPHDFLFEFYAATANAAFAAPSVPFGVLLMALAATSLWHTAADPFLSSLVWRAPAPSAPAEAGLTSLLRIPRFPTC